MSDTKRGRSKRAKYTKAKPNKGMFVRCRRCGYTAIMRAEVAAKHGKDLICHHCNGKTMQS